MTSRIIVAIVAVFAVVLSLAAPVAVAAQERNCEVQYELIDSYVERNDSFTSQDRVVTEWELTLEFMRSGGRRAEVGWYFEIVYDNDMGDSRQTMPDSGEVTIHEVGDTVRERISTWIPTGVSRLLDVRDRRDGRCFVY